MKDRAKRLRLLKRRLRKADTLNRCPGPCGLPCKVGREQHDSAMRCLGWTANRAWPLQRWIRGLPELPS